MSYTIAQRVYNVEQPGNGYLPIRAFSSKSYRDGLKLNSKENVHGKYVSPAVDFLTRFELTNNAAISFYESMIGADICWQVFGRSDHYNFCHYLLAEVQKGNIAAALQLAAYEGVYRSGRETIPLLTPDEDTIENIDIMVQRGIKFLKHCGPVLKSGFDFEGGYTSTIITGNGGYLTRNALIDFKVLRSNFSENHTLQILTYYLMGLRSVHEEFKNVQWLALFNPRKNLVKFINVNKIAASVIDKVKREVIGYRN